MPRGQTDVIVVGPRSTAADLASLRAAPRGRPLLHVECRVVGSAAIVGGVNSVAPTAAGIAASAYTHWPPFGARRPRLADTTLHCCVRPGSAPALPVGSSADVLGPSSGCAGPRQAVVRLVPASRGHRELPRSDARSPGRAGDWSAAPSAGVSHPIDHLDQGQPFPTFSGQPTPFSTRFSVQRYREKWWPSQRREAYGASARTRVPRSPSTPASPIRRHRSFVTSARRLCSSSSEQITSTSRTSAPAAAAVPTQPSRVSAVGLTHSTITSNPSSSCSRARA
jgi:hypothetical protein